ncbi:MAG: hypothetical protein EBV03_06840 [Proteobacteria bacterium]|nr:hypothetical protein [Pseudomonadota bacterium]
MVYGISIVLFLAFLLVLKIAKGILKLVLALVLVGVLIAVLNSKDDIERASPTTVVAPVDATATMTAAP